MLYNFAIFLAWVLGITTAVIGSCVVFTLAVIFVDKVCDRLGVEEDKDAYGNKKPTRDISNYSVLLLVFIMVVAFMLTVMVNLDEPDKGYQQRIKQAYTDGQTAAEHELPETCCPYGFHKSKYSITATEEYSSWMRGWTDKMIELKKGEKQ
jgi:hypothetical protein